MISNKHSAKFEIRVFLLSYLLLSSQLLSQIDWRKTEESHFRIYYTQSDNLYADELLTLFQIAKSDFENNLGLNLLHAIDVYLAPTAESFAQLTGNTIPHWGEGVANPVQNLIILKSPSITDQYSRLPQLVRHELMHIIIGQSIKLPQMLPRWFSEGIAIHFSNDTEFTGGESVSKALLTDSIIPLDEIDDVLQFQQAKARLAYEESYLFTLYLIDKFGTDRIVLLIQELRHGGSFEKTFFEVLETDLFDLELEWYATIKDKYRWRFLADFETFLWVFVLLLFIVVFIALRLRNRQTLKRWEQEDRLANL